MTSTSITKTPTSNQALTRFVAMASLYVLLIFLLPPSHSSLHDYHLTALQYRIVLLSLTLPTLVVWFAAFLGYYKLRQYAILIRETPEGPAFHKLATGCLWLALSLPLTAITGLLLSAAANHWNGFQSTSIITGNYLHLILPLIAFSIIGSASRELVNSNKLKFSFGTTRIIMVLFLAAGVVYCYLTFRQFSLTSLHASDNPYFLPLWLMVVTIIIPYLYVWFIGLLAAYEIMLYSKHIHGLLYRRSLKLMVAGLIAVITSSIALQYLNSVQPRVGHLILDYRLLINTLFSVVGGIGFVLLAMGAARLKRIEEV